MRAIGLMSGTSLDGVDAAWVESDGERIIRFGPTCTLPYDEALHRRRLQRTRLLPPMPRALGRHCDKRPSRRPMAGRLWRQR